VENLAEKGPLPTVQEPLDNTRKQTWERWWIRMWI